MDLRHLVGPLLTPEEELPRALVTLAAGRITAVQPLGGEAPPGAVVVERGWIAPGFIDLQINGAFGQDLAGPPADLAPLAAGLLAHGVTAYLPTLISSPFARYAALPELIARALQAPGAAALGLHLEGPYLQRQRRGAHQEVHLRLPVAEEIERLSGHSFLRLVTLAPELPGALAAIRRLRAAGVAVALGHTDATFAEAQAAIEAGARLGTHIFNAMRPLHQREPGVAGAMLADERVRVSLIADGVHVHPALLKLVWRAKGPDGVILVSDAMAAAGMAPGQYTLGAQDVHVDDFGVRLEDGTLAGSALLLDRAVANMVRWSGAAPYQVVRMATLNPARALDIEGERGKIAPGCRADLVILAPDLAVRATILAGQLAWGSLNGT